MPSLKESDWNKFCKANPSATDPDFAGFAKALGEYAKAEGKDVDQQLEALEEVFEMAEKAKKLSIKSKNKEVRRYLDDVLDEARKEMERLENEAPDPKDFLGDEEAYKNYLKKVMKKLTKKPMNFAAVFGNKPEEHKFIFHKSQDGKKLLKTLKDVTDLKKFAWGLAGGHAEQKSTLTLALEGPQIGGITKKGEKLLKYYKPLAFDTILLMVDGEIVKDLPDPDDDADEAEPAGPKKTGEEMARETPAPPTPTPVATSQPTPTVDNEALRNKLQEALNKLVPLLKQAVANYPDKKVELLTPVAQIKKQTDAGELQEAKAGILSLGQLLKSLAPRAPEVSIMKLGKARVEWLTTRDKAVTDLVGLKAKIAEELSDDGEQASALAEAMKTFDQIIATVENNLHEQLDAILNAEVNARGPLVKTAKATIAALVNTLTTDEVMLEIDGNEFDPTTKVVEPLNTKLQEISAALG